jgi:predicted phosphodiesterase
MERIALFGGVYSNHLALTALIADLGRRAVDQVFCLGDLGAFGPTPDMVFPLLQDRGIPVVQGNYDHSIGNGLADCQCGYTDPLDNYFAKLSYDYTFRNTSLKHKQWMQGLPKEIRLRSGSLNLLLCHGSPRRTNEFLWETTSSNGFLARLCQQFEADVIAVTHTGLHWHREVATGKHIVNCGAIGRPANEGRTRVWYAILEITGRACKVDFIPLDYDFQSLAAQMRSECLPKEFVETIETGWWTTCLEVLPMKERARGTW